MTSVLGHRYGYDYDLAGRLTMYTFPSGSETFVYDDDGRRIERTELINGVKRHGETFTYDARGRILTVRRTLSPAPDMWWEADLAYTGLGHLAASGVQDDVTGIYTGEEFRPDALNRMTWRKFRNSLMSDPPDEQFAYTWLSARLVNIDAETPATPPATWFPEHTYSLEDLSGNVERSGRYRQGRKLKQNRWYSQTP